ncbi:hypothetical protein CFOL_v3_01095, partial [Cephalotus follicularis]
ECILQERGKIFFFYRPKVDKEDAHSTDYVQRLYVVLRPESGERSVEENQEADSGKEGRPGKRGHEAGCGSVNIGKETLLRVIVMGRKSLPDPSKTSLPYWGFVEMVTTNIAAVKNALKGEEYDTSTRGHRHQPSARALGEGVYCILRHNPGKRMHTHLVYKLKLPTQDRKNENVPQKSLHIEHEGSFIIYIKNPDQHGSSNFRGLQNKHKAMFPVHLQGQFGQLRYCPADPPDFLNYKGCELLLVPASDDVEEELGLELKTECGVDASSSNLVNTFGDTASTSAL